MVEFFDSGARRIAGVSCAKQLPLLPLFARGFREIRAIVSRYSSVLVCALTRQPYNSGQLNRRAKNGPCTQNKRRIHHQMHD